MKTPILVAALVLAMTFLARAGEPSVPVPGAEQQKALVDGNNAFALDLYAKLRLQEGNLFFSPYSISTALAMTYAGARGDTEKQMAQAMHFSLGQNALHPAFAALVKQITPADPKTSGYELAIANALWGNQGYAFLPEFTRSITEWYGAPLREVNFADRDAAAKTINDWVAEKTNRKITDLISPDDLDAMTRLVLTNAIYFKGVWKSPFEKRATADGPFTLIDGAKVTVPMMFQTEDWPYADLGAAQLLSLPYKGDGFSMLILLPKGAAGLGRVESLLTGGALADWIGKLKTQTVALSMPRFKMTSRFSLGDTLIALGMKDAFSLDRADFSGVTGKQELFISLVLHKAFVDVKEEGTEAAAATAVIAYPADAEIVGMPIEFRADHPFIFLIRDDKTGSVLFMGRVMNPKS